MVWLLFLSQSLVNAYQRTADLPPIRFGGCSRLAAASVGAETGSGNVLVTASDAESVRARTGSGNVNIAPRGQRLQHVSGQTGSGNVGITLAPGAAFEVHAETGSGDVETAFADAQPLRDGHRVVGYRRGEGGPQIQLSTGAGNVVVE